MPYWINPLTDSRWTEFTQRHPSSSVFHTKGWLEALHRTYGFTPAVLTTSPPESRLENGIPFCRVESLLTGRRLSSLPFSDHCQPLAKPDEMETLLKALSEELKRSRLKYFELRPLIASGLPGMSPSDEYYYHRLDLRAPLEEISGKFHPNCIRRKIRRAAREGLTSEAGISGKLIDDFYTLQVRTRRKHGIPPQPKQWFRNLVKSMEGTATIRVARYGGRPVCSILTLRHKKTEIYKYGCSEPEDNKLGGMPLLLWQTIEEAKNLGMEELDLGRCDIDNEGLARFKERWGAERRELRYFRYPQQQRKKANTGIAARVFSKLPDPILKAVGKVLYRHFA